EGGIAVGHAVEQEAVGVLARAIDVERGGVSDGAGGAPRRRGGAGPGGAGVGSTGARKLGPSSGRPLTRRVSTTVASAGDARCKSTFGAVTSTVSVNAPSCSTPSTVRCWLRARP